MDGSCRAKLRNRYAVSDLCDKPPEDIFFETVLDVITFVAGLSQSLGSLFKIIRLPNPDVVILFYAARLYCLPSTQES